MILAPILFVASRVVVDGGVEEEALQDDALTIERNMYLDVCNKFNVKFEPCLGRNVTGTFNRRRAEKVMHIHSLFDLLH